MSKGDYITPLNADIHRLVSSTQDSIDNITIEATVVTGFEDVVTSECKEKINENILICKSAGRVFFNINIKDIEIVRKLRGIENIILIISSFETYDFSNYKLTDTNTCEDKLMNTISSEELSTNNTNTTSNNLENNKLIDIEHIKKLTLKINWKKYINIWKHLTNYDGIIFPSVEQFKKQNDLLRKNKILKKESENVENVIVDKQPETKNENNLIVDKEPIMNNEDKATTTMNEDKLLKFRVTCNRVGKHTFSSTDCERAFGGTLNDTFLWLVDLDDYNIDINIQIRENSGYIGMSITQCSLHKRNIIEFNITTLKPTIGYNLIRLAEPKIGDIFLDPMCGGGTIPIECTTSYPYTYFLSSDLNEKLVSKTQSNSDHNSQELNRQLKISPFVCNVKQLCLKQSSIDAVVSDLPFGKRVGSKSNNFLLYRLFLIEIGKVCKPNSGRAVLLTSDRRHLLQALHITTSLWKCPKIIKINMSGIKTFVFILSRTEEIFDYVIHSLKEKHKGKPLFKSK